MKFKSRHTGIVLLMILSQLLLTGFSFYWLKSQYNGEKKALSDKLSLFYKESWGVTLDTVLLRNYITPALGDSSTNHFVYKTGAGKVFKGDSIWVTKQPDAGNRESDSRAVVTIEMDGGNDSLARVNKSDINRLENEYLLRSVKLIVKKVDDSTGMKGGAIFTAAGELDSSIFINDFEGRIKNEGLKIVPAWVYYDSTGMMPGKKREMAIGNWTGELPKAVFDSYRLIIFERILPQIIFALVLILLTGSAFIIAYRSIMKQMMLNDMRSNLVSNISHELKTPVSTVKVALEAIRNFNLKNDRERTDEYLAIASGEIQRLEILISRVLDNNMIEHGQEILRPEMTDISFLVDDIIESTRGNAEKANAIIDFSRPDTPVMLLVDPLYVRGVIYNLVDNSLKYSGNQPHINIGIEVKGGSVDIQLSDSGPGIPDEYLGRVFEKFFRVPGGDTHNVKGYGLGLSYVDMVMKLHGGTVFAQNIKNGIMFTLSFPKEKD